MANLCIKKLYDAAWKVFAFQHEEALADRDELLTEIKERLGPKVASDIQCHVDVALGRIQADDVPNPTIMKTAEFYDLLAAETALQEIADRISANAVFVDSDNGLLPSLGLSWRDDIFPLIDGRSSPGNMAVANARKFLGIVGNTEGSAETLSEDVRKRRRELVEFLVRAVNLGKPIWCEL
jgi:hypothetical protein